MRTQDEIDVIELGKSVERLRANDDFKRVIEQEFMDKQALSIGKEFYGSEEQMDKLKSITILNAHLDYLVSSAIMITRIN